jgi:hypothetical protein
MLAPRHTGQEPDLTQRRVATHIVDVPMKGTRAFLVMSEPPTKSAGPESAADVGIESGLKIERAENTHLDSALGQRFEDEDVGTGLTRNRSGRRSAQRTLWVSALYVWAPAAPNRLTANLLARAIGLGRLVSAAVSR